LVGEISATIVAGKDASVLEKRISVLTELGKRLVDGSWSMDDGREVLDLVSGEDSEDNLRTFFDWKQETLANMNDPKSWSRFSEKWSIYLAKLPVDYLREKIEDFDKKMKQVRYWLMTLPTVKSPQRINEGASYLDDFLEEVWPFVDDSKSETLDIRDVEVAYAFDRNEGSFGYFPPGFTISLRNRKSLEEGISRIKQIIEYKDGLLPHLAQEKKRIEESGIPLKGDALFVYLRSLENAWAKQHFFRKRTKKAVPLHGFFPYRMPMIGEQNRILALTSVTMHGWNRLNREDFMKDISSSIPFLEVGGKYILGPINQSVYFGYSNDGFDAEALSSVLEELKGEGIISYEFHKGKKESKNTGFMDDNYEDVDEEEHQKINNNQILNDDESAHSLVITRLK